MNRDKQLRDLWLAGRSSCYRRQGFDVKEAWYAAICDWNEQVKLAEEYRLQWEAEYK